MYFKRINRIWLAFVLSIMLLLSSLTPAIASSNNLSDIANLAVVKQYEKYYNEKTPIGSSWGNIEAYDAYILSKAGVNLENWTRDNNNLKVETMALVNKMIENPVSAKHLAGGYLAAKLWGENDKAGELLAKLKRYQDNNSGSFDNDIYSDAPAIEYLGRANALSNIDVASAVYAIINVQYDNGAFGATFDGVDYFDVMASNQAIRGLSYLRNNTSDNNIKNKIDNSINKGLGWLKDLQQSDGSFINSQWDDKIINTAEVLKTLKTLGQEPSSWQKNGKSGLDYILENATNYDGTIGMGNVGNNTAIIDLAQIFNDYKVHKEFYIITSNYPKAEIEKGKTIQLEVSKFYLVGNREKITEDITWTSDAPNVAKVDKGIVTGISTGNVTITANYKGKSTKSIIEVKPSSGGSSEEKQGTAYLTIRGDSATGTILSSVPYAWTTKEVSVLDMLKEVLDSEGISYVATGGYVSEIKGLKEKKPGYPRSGWKYKVNGVIADKGAGAYLLESGDRVEWYYTLDYSKDEDASRWGTGSEGAKLNKKIPEEKVKELLDKFAEYDKELRELDNEVIIKNIDKRMDKEKAIKRDEQIKAGLVSLEQIINISKDNIITDDKEKLAILVPKGALTNETTITVVEKRTNELPNAYPNRIVAPIIELGPSGLSFAKEVKISIPIYLSIDFTPEQLVPAYYNDEKNEWEEVSGLIDLEKGIAIIKTNHFSKYSVIEKPVKQSFVDMTNDYNWAKEAVGVLAGQGIIRGSEKGFEPSREITRAEFSQLIRQMLVEPDTMPVEVEEFKDVMPSDWFSPAVTYLYQIGLIKGYEDGTFRPGYSLSRNEATVMLYKLSQEPIVNMDELNISDYKEIPEWAKPAVNWAYSTKIMSGYEDGSFKGTNSVTRAEAAVIIFNWLRSNETDI